jgi:cell division septation protein DedD
LPATKFPPPPRSRPPALKKDGYAIVVRHEPQDQLLHIQIGPFATRKDAEAMRQRVLADGFNAIVK